MRRWTVWWAILAGLYLLLADTVTWPEPVLGAVAAAIGATAAVLVAPGVRAPKGWARAAARPLLGVIGDLVPLARVLVTRGVLRRGDEGRLVEVALEDPHDVARRGWAEALGSLAPNTVVVDVDEQRGVLITHQLSPR
jgi:multisubunit Na+/H+ antiporter MnhE subunit